MSKEKDKQYWSRNPEQAEMFSEMALKDPKNRAKVKKILHNRAVRWSLKKSGALEAVEALIKKHEKA